MKQYVNLILLLLSTALVSTAADAQVPAGEKPADAKFKGVSKDHIATLMEIERENPKFIAAWTELRRMQDEMRRLTEVFGVEKRKLAEREMASLKGQLAKQKEEFRKLYERERGPIIEKESSLKDQAFRLSQKPASASESKRAAEDKKQEELYEEIAKLGARIRAIDSTEVLTSRLQLPDRLEQLGVRRQDAELRKELKPYTDLIEPLLSVKDCLVDIAELEAREGTPDWTSADAKALTIARSRLDKATANLEKEVAKLKKPIEKELAKVQKKADSLKAKIETLAKRRRPTAQYDAQLAVVEKELTTLNSPIETITEFTDVEKLKPKQKAK